MDSEVRLADGRKKGKWSTDPRGTAWANDKEKFGYRMLMKMGWSDGRGLGVNLHGETKHVKVAAKKDSGGLGLSDDHASNWVEHQDSFNDILATLQKHSGSEPGSTEPSRRSSPTPGLQAKASQTRSRINYSKILRGKDLSRYSSADLNCILGKQPMSGACSDESVSSDNSSDEGISAAAGGITTVKSGQSVQDYFAAKLAKLHGTPVSIAKTTTATASTDEERKAPDQAEWNGARSEKKSRRKENAAKALDGLDKGDKSDDDDKRHKKKKKAKRRMTIDEDENNSGNEPEMSERMKKKEKKKKRQAVNSTEDDKRRMNRKRKHDDTDVDVHDELPEKRKKKRDEANDSVVVEQERTAVKKKKKKKKKRHNDSE